MKIKKIDNKNKIIIKVKTCNLIDINKINKFSSLNLCNFLVPNYINKKCIEFSDIPLSSLAQKLRQPISKLEFVFYIKQIIGAIKELEKNNYLSYSLIINFNQIFIDNFSNKLLFIYLPLKNSGDDKNKETLFKNFIYSVIPQSDDDRKYIFKFSNYINKMRKFDLNLILKYIEKQDKKNSDGITLPHYEDETQLLRTNETILLNNDNNSSYSTLIRKKNNKKYKIEKEVVYLGTDKNFADYYIKGNNTISRKHAQIILISANYYIIDLNSTNGTYVNYKKLIPNQKYKLSNGDKIKLSNEIFIFTGYR